MEDNNLERFCEILKDYDITIDSTDLNDSDCIVIKYPQEKVPSREVYICSKEIKNILPDKKVIVIPNNIELVAAKKNYLKKIVYLLEKQIYKDDSWKEELYKILKDKFDSDFLIEDGKGRLCVTYNNPQIRGDIALEKAIHRTVAINIPRDSVGDILVIYDYLGQVNRS